MAESPGRFSIQKYENVEFHYLFRLEVGGKVHSWVVPKGPSPDPRVKRLAIPVDDPIAIDFEGVVKEGERQGKVIVWDIGPYEPREVDGEPLSIEDGLEEGRIDIEITGEKLTGGFTLLRVDEGTHERWLLMKISDEEATRKRNPVMTEPLSIISGKKVEEIEDE